MTQDPQEKYFQKLLTRYQTAFFELNDYETSVLPDFKNGKVVNRGLVITLDDFEATISFMEQVVLSENAHLANTNMVQYEEGRVFFNWLILSRIVEMIRNMVGVK